MTAGLPGVGLGGLFYFCLVLWMPIRELYLVLHGRSEFSRWKTIAFFWLVLGGIFAALWSEAEILEIGAGYVETTHTMLARWCLGMHQLRTNVLSVTGEMAIVVTFSILGGICLLTFILNLAARWGLLESIGESAVAAELVSPLAAVADIEP
jgi:hypothetical protein